MRRNIRYKHERLYEETYTKIMSLSDKPFTKTIAYLVERINLGNMKINDLKLAESLINATVFLIPAFVFNTSALAFQNSTKLYINKFEIDLLINSYGKGYIVLKNKL